MEYVLELVIGPKDPRSEYLFAKTSFTPLVIISFYSFFVFKFGPKWMEKRAPFELKGILILYNLAQVIINLCMFLEVSKIIGDVSPICQPVDTSSSDDVLHIIWLFHIFYLLKLLDLLDTIFFVLRKKYDQISSLHVYHHMSMVIAGWAAFRYYPGGQAIHVGFVNCFVHTIMYFYYFLTVVNPKYKKNIEVKKRITQLQLAQHFYLFWVMLNPVILSNCGYPAAPCFLFLPNVILMISLFLKFYYQNYVCPKKNSAK